MGRRATVSRGFLSAMLVVAITLIAGGVYLITVLGGPSKSSSVGSTSSASSGSTPVILSYNFQVNSTGGTLFVVLKNYASSNMSVSRVSLDDSEFNGTSLKLDSGCQNLILGNECGISLYFGSSHLPPEEGTNHTLTLVTASGVTLTYAVTSGSTYHAACTYTSSC